MKTSFISLLFLSQLVFSLTLHASNVDLKKSNVWWQGSKVIGSSHEGAIQIKSGNVHFKAGEPYKAEIVVDMNSITCQDIKNETYNKKLVGHLKNDDFFGVDRFPTAKIKADKILKVNDEFYQLHAKITIKGVTKDLKVKARIVEKKDTVMTVQSEFEFDRTDFGIRYGSGSFFSNLGEKMISDKVQVKVSLVVDKNKKVASL